MGRVTKERGMLRKEDLVQPAGVITAALIAKLPNNPSTKEVGKMFHEVLQALIDEQPKIPPRQASADKSVW
jgi:hypothetical protein